MNIYKIREQRLRRMAKRCECRLEKSRIIKDGYPCYYLHNEYTNNIINYWWGENVLNTIEWWLNNKEGYLANRAKGGITGEK